MNTNNIIKGGIYRHYKGAFVEVLDIGKDTETGLEMVIYHHVIYNPPEIINHEDPENKTIWIKPAIMWNEYLNIWEGINSVNSVPRFTLVWRPDEVC